MMVTQPTINAAKRPPSDGGVRGRLAFLGFGRDPLGFIERLTREHPGAARMEMPGLTLVYLTDPAAIGEVLLDRDRIFAKDWTTRMLRDVLGNGLFTSEGDFWRRQRNLVAPALHRKQIAAYVDLAARRAATLVGGLRDGEVRDVQPDMTRLTMAIVAEALFGTDIGDAADRVARALEQALAAYQELIYTWRRFVPVAWDQPVRARLRAAGQTLGAIVEEIIARKRAAVPGNGKGNGHDNHDLLSRLLAAQDDQGVGMTGQQIRDEVVTMLLAGHETTAMALTFALDFLARHPAEAERVASEAARVLGDRLPVADDVPALAAATAAFKETLRLRPPLWLFGREAREDVVVGGWRILKGEQVLISPWLMHHQSQWFEDPKRFLPQRWTADLEERLPRHVYLPFGGGVRVCAGLHFALMEGTIILASLCRAFRLSPAHPSDLALNPAVTLRPGGPVRVRFSARGTPVNEPPT